MPEEHVAPDYSEQKMQTLNKTVFMKDLPRPQKQHRKFNVTQKYQV